MSTATSDPLLMQGNCEGAPPEVESGPPIGTLAPGQCVVSVNATLFLATPGDEPDTWLDRLHIRYVGSTVQRPIMYFFGTQ